MFSEFKNKYFGSSLANSNINAVNAYGWGVQFRVGSPQNFLVKYFGIFHLGARIRNKILERILENKDLHQKKLLDAGCGIGLASLHLSDRFAFIVGIDLNKQKISQAKLLAKNSGISNIKFKVADLTKPSSIKQLFDVIICFEVIEHVHDDQKFLLSLDKLLNVGGELIFSFPSKSLISLISQKSLDHYKIGYLPADIKYLLKPTRLKIFKQFSFGKSIVGKSVVFMDFLLRRTVPLLASALFPIFYPIILLDYYLPAFGIPRGCWFNISSKWSTRQLSCHLGRWQSAFC